MIIDKKLLKISNNKWVYLIVLSLIWGSSFILMKKGLIGLSPIEVGVFRMLFSSIFLLLIAFKSLKKIKKQQWKYIAITGFLGTFVPVFLFAYAIEGIDSSVVSILNSLTPFNTFLIGMTFFHLSINKRQFSGLIAGLVGTIILIITGASMNPDQNYWYAILVISASMGYGLNVNIIKKHLSDIPALSITTGHFAVIVIPAFLVLIFSGFFTTFEYNDTTISSLGYIFVLAILGTALAKVLFNKLIQLSSPVFSTSVTYLIPIVAVLWGVIDGEQLSFTQLLAAAVILIGVYMVNSNKIKSKTIE